jgi:UDP-N-acetylmuramyl pentapeptide phosphotransferase/UDP-N-acetylglucosamine-1-phosphate transferase
MAAGAVLGAASIYLRFIIQPTTAPDATPTTSVVAIVARRLRLQMSTRARGQPTTHLELHKTIGVGGTCVFPNKRVP